MEITLAAALKNAAQQLMNTDVPALEAEVLLGHVLQVSRSYLHTWPENNLSETQQEEFFQLVQRRAQGEPIAYLTGHKEFWSQDLLVTPCVLIPRPETELLVETVLSTITTNDALVADLGTGSGAIALAIASERPHWTVHATDASLAVLEVAKENAKRLKITNIFFYQGNWCAALPDIKFDVIVSNPPYIAENDPHLSQGDLRFEPQSALVSAENGFKDLQLIISQAKNYLKPNGFLMLEHGAEQARNVASILKNSGYTSSNVLHDLAGLDRITIASGVHF